MRARIIEAMMCDFHVSTKEITSRFDISQAALNTMFKRADDAMGNLLDVSDAGLSIPAQARPLTRMIARQFDAYDLSRAGHSSAI